MAKRKVYIVEGNAQYSNLFTENGWIVTHDIYDADLIQFTGGEDVSPELYGEHRHARTYSSLPRDKGEMQIYALALSIGTPMAGICRGGQFLNVMNGGKMYQDVDNHAIQGTHEAYIVGNLISVQVSSTHHQMMRPDLDPDKDAQIIMTAALSERKAHMSGLDSGGYEIVLKTPTSWKEDVEAVYYGATNCLCFQPHPEFPGPLYKECRQLYFQFINEYLFGVDEESVEESRKTA